MSDPLTVKCPFCEAEPGEPCTDAVTAQEYPPHRGRVLLADDKSPGSS